MQKMQVRGTQYVVPSTWYPVRGTQSFSAMRSHHRRLPFRPTQRNASLQRQFTA